MTDRPAPLRPRAERCPETDCTDEQQCWRCDYEESQHATATAIAAGYCPHCGRGDCAPTADEYEASQRRAIRIQTLLDEHRDQARKNAADHDRVLDQLLAEADRIDATTYKTDEGGIAMSGMAAGLREAVRTFRSRSKERELPTD